MGDFFPVGIFSAYRHMVYFFPVFSYAVENFRFIQ